MRERKRERKGEREGKKLCGVFILVGGGLIKLKSKFSR